MLTVPFLKTRIQDQIAPGNDAEFLRILQETEIRLAEVGRWLWTKARVTLTPVSGIITLNGAYASILGAHIDGNPVDLNAQDREFVPDGIGEIEVGGGGDMRLIDMGFNASEEREYKVIGVSNFTDRTIVGLVHRAPNLLYDPDISDSDIPDGATVNLSCPDMGAIKLASLGIIAEEALDMGNSFQYFKAAYARLNEHESSRRGNAIQQPTIRPAGRGIRGIRTFR